MDGKIVAERLEQMKKGQAERLFPLLEEVLDASGTAWKDLDAIGVGVGPGNFTGIRIAVSAARGLSYSLKAPAVGVSTLRAQAFGLSGVVVSSVAGLRETVYAQAFGPGVGSDPLVGDPHSLPLNVSPRSEPICVGAMAEVFAERFAGTVAEPLTALTEAIARVALARLGNAHIPQPAPLYIRPPDAAPASDPPPVVLP